MRFIIVGIIALLTVACAATYTQPTTVAAKTSSLVTASKSDILVAAKRVLISEGYQITNSDDSAGIISTALQNLRVTLEQADCGKTMGIDYLKDNRTATRVGFGVIADEGKITVKSTIEGEYKPGAVDQNITLNCVSRGQLEREMLSKIVAAIAK